MAENDLPGMRRDLAARVLAIKARRAEGTPISGEDIDFLIAMLESSRKDATDWSDEWTKAASAALAARTGDLSNDPEIDEALRRRKT